MRVEAGVPRTGTQSYRFLSPTISRMLHKTTTSFDHLFSRRFAGNTYTYLFPSFHSLRYSYAPLHIFCAAWGGDRYYSIPCFPPPLSADDFKERNNEGRTPSYPGDIQALRPFLQYLEHSPSFQSSNISNLRCYRERTRPTARNRHT